MKLIFIFHDYKFAVGIGEKDHQDRDINREIERQKTLGRELGCKFKAQNEILRHIK